MNFITAILTSLPESYNNLVLVLESQKDITLDFILNRLIEENQKRNNIKDSSNQSQVFSSKSKRKFRKGKQLPNKDIVCPYCHKVGHPEYKCWEKYPKSK